MGRRILLIHNMSRLYLTSMGMFVSAWWHPRSAVQTLKTTTRKSEILQLLRAPARFKKQTLWTNLGTCHRPCHAMPCRTARRRWPWSVFFFHLPDGSRGGSVLGLRQEPDMNDVPCHASFPLCLWRSRRGGSVTVRRRAACNLPKASSERTRQRKFLPHNTKEKTMLQGGREANKSPPCCCVFAWPDSALGMSIVGSLA